MPDRGMSTTLKPLHWAWVHRLLGCPNCVICNRHYGRVFRGR